MVFSPEKMKIKIFVPTHSIEHKQVVFYVGFTQRVRSTVPPGSGDSAERVSLNFDRNSLISVAERGSDGRECAFDIDGRNVRDRETHRLSGSNIQNWMTTMLRMFLSRSVPRAPFAFPAAPQVHGPPLCAPYASPRLLN